MANFIQKSSDQQHMISYRPTTLPINGQYASNTIHFTPSDLTKIQMSTPELDIQARGFTTPDLINALSGPIGFSEQISPGTKFIEEMINVQQMSNHPTSTGDSGGYGMVPTSNYILRNRSISSSIQDQDSSNSTSASSPPQRGEEMQNVPSEFRNSSNQDDFLRKEKKRERNRQAAQKCRTRKLNRIAELQKRVDELQSKNQNLTGLAETLRGDVTRLERQLDYHRNQGCNLASASYQN